MSPDQIQEQRIPGSPKKTVDDKRTITLEPSALGKLFCFTPPTCKIMAMDSWTSRALFSLCYFQVNNW